MKSVQALHPDRELGFENVTALEWWQSTRGRDIDVDALPFYGEVLPTLRTVHHVAVRGLPGHAWPYGEQLIG
jgi:hypothetical protein